MAKCPYCSHELTLPPSLPMLFQNHPNTTPDGTLNRSVPRCKHCDLSAANKRAIDAECPPPTYQNPIKKVEQQIEQAKSLIEHGIRKDDLLRILPNMEKKRVELVGERDRGIRRAWDEYWGIWGMEEGLDKI